MTDAIVVGAGLAGLSAARHLQQAGLDVTVLDAAPVPGGRVATDVVDGFLLDRGFQVLNTSYPALRGAVDLDSLDLRRFTPGAAVRGTDGALHHFVDPRRAPRYALRTAFDGLLPLGAKAAVLRLSLRAALGYPRRLIGGVERDTAGSLARRGLGGAATEQVLRPFLAGIFGERDLSTSDRFFTLVWRSFARGDSTLPSRGMAALPVQLAARLRPGSIRYSTTVLGVAPGRVRTADGDLSARAVVVATDPPAARALLPGLDVPPMRALTTYYHVSETPPTRSPLIHLDGTGGPVVNTSVLTLPAPSYSPDHRHLVSSTVLGDPAAGGVPNEKVVRDHLARIYGASTAAWEHLSTVAVPDALCAFTPPTPRRLQRPTALGDGLFVAGDHRDTPSIQGALVSGRRAAAAVRTHLGVGRSLAG